jgi:hypothetical protein
VRPYHRTDYGDLRTVPLSYLHRTSCHHLRHQSSVALVHIDSLNCHVPEEIGSGGGIIIHNGQPKTKDSKILPISRAALLIVDN